MQRTQVVNGSACCCYIGLCLGSFVVN
uniref:Uncharacterized protein n=1 Tax=Rhizophora mucronata TaxID=61149 RepID=A0A2P2PDA3_RHIMU